MSWVRSTHCAGGTCIETTYVASSHCADRACIQAAYVKSSHSGVASCVQAASCACGHTGRILVRDSKNPDGLILSLERGQWLTFLDGIRSGDFEQLSLPGGNL